MPTPPTLTDEQSTYLNLTDAEGTILTADLEGNASFAAAKVLLDTWLSVPATERDTDQMSGDAQIVADRIKEWAKAAIAQTEKERA
jgi:hypothetical protein